MSNAAEPARSAPAAYFDAASSEPLHPAARAVLLAAYDTGYADPRRLHGPARNTRLLLDNARAVVAESLGVRADEVSFVSSGTEAVQRGLLGLLAVRTVGPVVCSAVEHSSLWHAARWAGREVVTVPVSPAGAVEAEEFVRLSQGAAVAALQAANHEVGTVQPIDAVVSELGDVPLLVDACAAMGRTSLPPGSVIAGSAHKWGGPAGVGVLVVRKGVRWENPFPEDDRGDERVSGFENVPAALAAAAALQAVVAEQTEIGPRQREWIDRIRTTASALPDVEVVGDPDERLPHLVTFSCLYLSGERLVTELDRRGFAVASGSACTASTLEPSHVLAAMGALTHGNVRVSLTRDATEEAVAEFCAVLPEVVQTLRAEVDL